MVAPRLLDDAVLDGGPGSAGPHPIDAQGHEAKAAVGASPTGSALNEAVATKAAQAAVRS